MQLFEEILLQELKQRSNFSFNATAIVESICYQTLQKIKAIIEDDSLDDLECFMRIEQIVCAFEEIGSSGGNRHDFG